MTTANSGVIEWECPSNIALIKYWGKKEGQIPMNPSLSFTLSESVTNLTMEYSYGRNQTFLTEFLFDGKPNPVFGRKIADYLLAITPILPALRHINLKINSVNTFPHSSGIASSASSFGALALALCSLENMVTGTEFNEVLFYKRASYLARLASGSACRSVFGGFVIWGLMDEVPGSGDEAAVPLTDIHREFRDIRDSILIVSSGTKAISSSKGHELMNRNPFASTRAFQAVNNLKRLITSLTNGELNDFIEIIETEALTLHAMMMTSSPGYFLIIPQTLEIIGKIRKFRADTGLPVGFTLDAGPNVHFIYPHPAEMDVRRFIEKDLTEYCENSRVIHDKIGRGPERKR